MSETKLWKVTGFAGQNQAVDQWEVRSVSCGGCSRLLGGLPVMNVLEAGPLLAKLAENVSLTLFFGVSCTTLDAASGPDKIFQHTPLLLTN